MFSAVISPNGKWNWGFIISLFSMITQTYRQGRIDWYFSDFWKQYMLLVWFCSIGFDSITRDNIFHFKRKHKKKKYLFLSLSSQVSEGYFLFVIQYLPSLSSSVGWESQLHHVLRHNLVEVSNPTLSLLCGPPKDSSEGNFFTWDYC